MLFVVKIASWSQSYTAQIILSTQKVYLSRQSIKPLSTTLSKKRSKLKFNKYVIDARKQTSSGRGTSPISNWHKSGMCSLMHVCTYSLYNSKVPLHFKNGKKGYSVHSNVDDHAYRAHMCNSNYNSNKFPWLFSYQKA